MKTVKWIFVWLLFCLLTTGIFYVFGWQPHLGFGAGMLLLFCLFWGFMTLWAAQDDKPPRP